MSGSTRLGHERVAAPRGIACFVRTSRRHEYERYRRGRTAGEGARLLAEGLLATGFPAERVVTFNEEADAVAHVIDVMRPGDIVVIIADAASVLQEISPWGTGAAQTTRPPGA